MCYHYLKRALCSFVLFMKTQKTIYKKFYYVKDMLSNRFRVFQRKLIYKEKCGTATK